MRSRKAVYRCVTLVVAATLIASGCSSGSKKSPATSAAAPGSSTGSTTPSSTASGTAAPVRTAGADLVIWTDQLKAPAMQKFANDFGAANGIKVAVQVVATNLQSNYITATNAGQGPDVVAGANDWIGNMVQNGTIEPLNVPQSVQSEFLPIAMKGVTYNGQVYGIPYDVENLALFYNKTLVPTPPTSIEQLVSMGKALIAQKKVSQILALPVGQQGDPYNAEPLYTSAGGYMFGVKSNGDYDPSDLGLAKPSAVAAYQKIQGLAKEGALKQSITDDNVISLFADGKAAFLQSGPWAIQQIGTKVKYGVVPMVGFSGGKTASPFVGMQAFYVSSKAKNKSFAEEFVINYLTKEASQKALYDLNPLPSALTSLYNAEANSDPVIKGFGDGAKVGQVLPSIPAMSQVWTPLGIAEAAVIGGAGPSTAIGGAATAIEAAIKAQK